MDLPPWKWEAQAGGVVPIKRAAEFLSGPEHRRIVLLLHPRKNAQANPTRLEHVRI